MNNRVILLGFSLLLCSCETTKEAYVETGISQLVQITTDKSFELDPTVSHDGNRLLFASDRSGYLELWMMPVKGGGIQQITTSSSSADAAPDLSSDEKEIVFESTRVTGTWNIWKMTLGTRGLTQLTNNQFGSFAPKWSPDGKRIAFCALDKDDGAYIWVMGPNGEDPTQLGPGEKFDWSPDGKKFVYSRKTSEENYDIWTMNSDGSGAVQLSSDREKQETSPVWSRDGRHIAYVVKYDRGDYYRVSKGQIRSSDNLRSEIWMMDSDSRNQTQLTAFKGLNFSPAWSVDNRIFFVSSRGNSWDLWSMLPTSLK